MLFSFIFDGFGLLVLEAVSLGMPVLTGNGSSLPEVRVTRRCWSIRTAPPRLPPASPGWTAMRACASSWQQQGRSRRNLGSYEKLRVQQEFAAKNYTAAAAGLVKAQEDATRQQLYIVRVVDANMPVSRCSRSARIVLMTFISLCVAYGIGWLILAGVREHAA